MSVPRPSQPSRSSLPGPLGRFLLDRLALLDARADHLARQAEAKGDLRTALTATRLSVSILAQMARWATKCPEAALDWQPPVVAGPPVAPAASAPATDPNPAAPQVQKQPTGYSVPLIKPVNTHWHRGR